MATTTNFGWETPDDTDLVKDGAAAIRTLGSAIDTSLLDLKGGTTNQVLAKNSNTDLDFKWVTDATGIQATIFDAKGDIIAATAADTADRLAVGTNGQVLTADSTTSTGLKWATPASGGKVLQVVSKTVTTTTSVASGNTTTTGLTQAFTPTSATSKVLVLVSQPLTLYRNNSGGVNANVALRRDSSSLGTIGEVAWNNLTVSAGNGVISAPITACYLDSPATTSSVTYDTQLTTSTGGTADTHKTQTLTLIEIGA